MPLRPFQSALFDHEYEARSHTKKATVREQLAAKNRMAVVEASLYTTTSSSNKLNILVGRICFVCTSDDT